MDEATARAWLDAEMTECARRLITSPGDPAAQGRLGRLQRHASRLIEMGSAYLPTLSVEAGEPIAVVDLGSDLGEPIVEPATPKKTRR